jgi:hypothetical protein
MRRPPPWIALAPHAAAAVVLGIGLSAAVRATRAAASAGGERLVWVDPGAVVLDDFPDWADPRWREELERLLALWPSFPVGSQEARAELRAGLAALSFVRAVDAPSIDAAGGMRLGFALRRPVAAIQGPEGFLTVDAEGVVLAGRWPAPPLLSAPSGDLALPVILPGLADLDPEHGDPAAAGFAFDLAVPGDWLVEPEHLAALDTAVSLARHLGPEDRARLGRAAIDGAGHDVRSARDLGVLIGLEDGRWIAFGRPPTADAPGELAPEKKWASVARALALARAGADDSAWEIVDVRWDVPELRFAAEARGPVVALLERARPSAPPGEPGFPSGWRTDGGEWPPAQPERRAPRPQAGTRAEPRAEPRAPADSAVADRPRVR